MKASGVAKLLLDIRDGFWLRPLAMLAGGVAAGLLATRVDQWLIEADLMTSSIGHASPGGARALLSVAAGALATTLAISLSMTMVTVQLGSSQYTPRLVRRFLSDRFTQVVLGAFLGAIAYEFLVLRAIRSPDEGQAFVPMLALSAAVLATLSCLALLVVFLHRTMRGMQASTIIASIGRETVAMIETATSASLERLTAPLPEPSEIVRSAGAGYIQFIDDASIRSAVPPSSLGARREVSTGDFVLPGTPLVSLFGVGSLPEDTLDAIRGSFSLGSERTPRSDSTFGVRQLVDMALKALSPGINDVTTAVMVVNELGVIAHAVALTGLDDDVWCIDREATAVMYVSRPLSLQRYLALAFGEIVPAAADHPRVIQRIVELLDTIDSVAKGSGLKLVLQACTADLRPKLEEARARG